MVDFWRKPERSDVQITAVQALILFSSFSLKMAPPLAVKKQKQTATAQYSLRLPVKTIQGAAL